LGPFFHLLFNHVIKSSRAQLKITSDYIEFIQRGNHQKIELPDVQDITICSKNGKKIMGNRSGLIFYLEDQIRRYRNYETTFFPTL
jgi:hypothetical protein